MATWNASANAQMAQIANDLTAQQSHDVRAAISQWADQHHDGNTELKVGGYLFQIVVRNDIIERVTFGR